MSLDNIQNASIATSTTYAATGVTLFGWLTNNMIGIIGLVVAIITGLANIYFRYRDDQRKEMAFKLQMDEQFPSLFHEPDSYPPAVAASVVVDPVVAADPVKPSSPIAIEKRKRRGKNRNPVKGV